MKSHANNPLMVVLKELDNDFLFVEFVEKKENTGGLSWPGDKKRGDFSKKDFRFTPIAKANNIYNNPANKKAILAIAAQHSSDDRFTRDPLISNDLAKKRLELYITKSLNSHPKQFVYGLYNQQTDELIGFRTGIFAEPGLVKYFYYFMQKEYNDAKYISMLETGVLEALVARKVNRIEAVSSGLNVPEMNDSSLMQGFVVEKTMVLMRKIFWVDEV